MVERESNKHREKPAAGPVIPSSLESQEIWEAVILPAVSQPFTLLNLPLPGTIGSPRAPTPRGSAHPVPPLLPHSAAAPGHLSATWWPPVELPHRPPRAGPCPAIAVRGLGWMEGDDTTALRSPTGLPTGFCYEQRAISSTEPYISLCILFQHLFRGQLYGATWDLK